MIQLSEYEFDKNQEQVIKNVATRCIIQAVLIILGSITGFLPDIIYLAHRQSEFTVILLVQAVLQIIIGILFLRPVNNFRRIASTEGSDISELMIGLKDLSISFMIIVFLILGNFVFNRVIRILW